MCNSRTKWWTSPRSCKGRPPPFRREMAQMRAETPQGQHNRRTKVSAATPLGEVGHAKKKREAGAHVITLMSRTSSGSLRLAILPIML